MVEPAAALRLAQIREYVQHKTDCERISPLCRLCGHRSTWLDHSIGFVPTGHRYEPDEQPPCTCGLIEALVDLARAEQTIRDQHSEWQPIDTAPMDGSTFLGGWRHRTYGWLWSRCRHQDDRHYPGGYFVMEGGGEPTHWLPLPDPPVARSRPATGAPETETRDMVQAAGTAPFVDTPLLAAKRQAFDSPTQANLDALTGLARHDPSPEVCICAAIRLIDSRVIRGHRHDDCIQTALKWKTSAHGSTQGFVTSRNRFVDRYEGAALQNAAGIESVAGYRGDILFSEDLY